MDAGAVHDYFAALQERIVAALEVVDRKGFTRDSWQRAEGGGGTTCIVENGQVFPLDGPGLGLSLKPEVFQRDDAERRVSGTVSVIP